MTRVTKFPPSQPLPDESVRVETPEIRPSECRTPASEGVDTKFNDWRHRYGRFRFHVHTHKISAAVWLGSFLTQKDCRKHPAVELLQKRRLW